MSWISEFRSEYEYRNPLEGVEVPFVDTLMQTGLFKPEWTITKNLNTLVFGVLLYHGMFLATRLLLLNKGLYDALRTKKNRVDIGIRIVSFFQSTLIVFLGIPLFNNKYLNEDRVFASTPYAHFYSTLALSYFIWDTLMSLYYVRLFGVGFLVHGVMSCAAFGSALQSNMIMYYSPIFLLFEISTPFLNVRWFGLKFSGIPDWVQLLNNIVLILIFFFIRLCWGWYQIYRLATDLVLARNDPRFVWQVAAIIVSSNFVLDILNAYWFSKMMIVAVTTIKQMIGGERDKEDEKLKLM